MLDIDTIEDMFASVPVTKGLAKRHPRKFVDTHKDADDFLAADEATRESMRVDFKEKLNRRIKELARVPLGWANPSKLWRERNPDRYQAASKRWNAKWKERHPEQFRLMRQRVNAQQGHKRRMKNLAKHIEGWSTTAKLIIVGRDLEAKDTWQEILLAPGNATELDARTDFIFFLRHRGMSTRGIATMLGTDLPTVKAALASRGK